MRKKCFMLLGSFCLVLVVALMIAFSGDVEVLAADDNDTFVNAVEFTSKKPAQDMIDTEDDIDWFSYTVDSDGGIYFSLTNLERDGASWTWEMYDEKAQTVLWSAYTDKSTFINDSPLMSFEKGTKLLFKISKYWGNSYCVQKNYKLSSTIDNKQNWEIEDDDSFSRATEITDSKKTVGVLNFESDADWYQYYVTDTNPLQFVFTNLDKNGAFWNIKVYDEDSSTILWQYNTDSGVFVY